MYVCRYQLTFHDGNEVSTCIIMAFCYNSAAPEPAVNPLDNCPSYHSDTRMLMPYRVLGRLGHEKAFRCFEQGQVLGHPVSADVAH